MNELMHMSIITAYMLVCMLLSGFLSNKYNSILVMFGCVGATMFGFIGLLYLMVVK